MTQAQLKRKFPRLVRKAEESTRIKFKHKPVLKFRARAYPQTTLKASRDRAVVKTVHVQVSKRMAREDPKLAEVCVLHELRETLYFQRGYSERQADLKAQRFESGDMRRAGFGDRKKLGWLLRKHYGR